MKKIILVIIIISTLIFSSCAIGYKTLTTKKMERKAKRGKKVELVIFSDLPKVVADTLADEYEKYRIINQNNPASKSPSKRYYMSHFISYDSAVKGEHIKYQDFYSEKFGLPFGYFFRFGKKKFYIPYRERSIGYPYIYYDGCLYIYGKYFGNKKRIDTPDNPEFFNIDYQNRAYWKWKIKL